MQTANPLGVLILGRREDPLPQRTYVRLDLPPANPWPPVETLVFGSVRRSVQHPPQFPAHPHLPFTTHLAHVSPISRPGSRPVSKWLSLRRLPGGAARAPRVSQCLSASWHSLLEPSCSRHAHQRPLRARPPARPARDGVPVFRTLQTRPGRAPPIPRGQWCPRTEPFSVRCHLPDLPRPALATPDICHPRGSTLTRGRRRFTHVRPSRSSPCPRAIGRLTARFGFSRGLRTPSLPTTHATVGTGPWTLARTTCSTTKDATSKPCSN